MAPAISISSADGSMPLNKVINRETIESQQEVNIKSEHLDLATILQRMLFTLGAIRTLLAPREVLRFCCEQAGVNEADELGR